MNHRSHSWQAIFLAIFICIMAVAPGPMNAVLADVATVAPAQAARSDLDPGATLNWYIQTVGAPSQKWLQEPGARDLAVDAAGNLHLAYGGDHLYYARFDGSAWHQQTVDGADHVGAGASLALDSRGYPSISYCDEGNSTVKVARWQGVAWEIRSLIDAGGCDRTALALDGADMPHIAWVTTVAKVQYATWNGRSWTIQMMGDGEIADLILDRAGQPHIAYSHDFSLTYAWYDGQGWRQDILAVLNNSFRSLSLAADPQGNTGFAYILASEQLLDPRSYRLGYARRSDGAWTFAEDVRLSSDTAALALALDAAGRAHIAYRDGSALRYRQEMDTTWQDQIIDRVQDGRADDWCRGIGIALDAQGSPHVGYLKTTSAAGSGSRQQGALRQATLHDDIWTADDVDTWQDVGLRGALVLDTANDARVSYRDGDGALRYAAWANGRWMSETVDGAPGPMFGQTALALDSGGAPHIGYIASDGALNYARRTAAGWQVTTVAHPGGELIREGYEADLALALDDVGNPHIGYLDASCATCEPMLKYAHWMGSGWEIRDGAAIPAKVYGPHALALAIDATGTPHFIYESAVNTLRYAYWTGSDWAIQDIANDLSAGRGLALTLDRSQNPHVSYVAGSAPPASTGLSTEPAPNLKYAMLVDGRWQSQVVATGDIRSPALQLDDADAPHISYYDALDSNQHTWELRYAIWTGGAWQNQTVDALYADVSVKAAEIWTSLALDRSGRPAIAYYDPSLHAARYAMGSPLVAAADCGPVPTPGSVSPGPPASTSGVVQRQIGHCLDDAHVSMGNTTELQNGALYVRMGGRAGVSVPYVSYVDGLLFRDVQVPRASQIISATLRVAPWFQAGVVVVEVAGQLSPQAETFSAANPWPQQRPKTSQRVPWIVSGVVTQVAESPDLAPIMQEIVAQDDWQAGNDLALLISPILTGRQYVDWQAYDFGPANAAQLTISYRVAETETPTPTATPAPTATPSVTPTVTPTPTATATRSSWPGASLYLPLVLSR